MVRALRSGIEGGTIRAVDPEEVATVLWAAWNGIISLAGREDPLGRDPAGLSRLLQVATDTVAHGLLAGSGQQDDS